MIRSRVRQRCGEHGYGPVKQIGAEHGDCRDSGAGTVLTVGIALGTIVLIAALLALAQATVGAARAGVAADLAALAGADTIRGLRAGDPCSVAEDVVARNGGDLAWCAPDVGSRSVTVEVRARAGGLLHWVPSASARAGPPR